MRKHLTYANVMVTLLALGALTGGVAYAANTVGSSDIINESILSQDVKNNQVLATDVRNGDLNDEDIAKKKLVNFVVNIGNVSAHHCVNTAIDPFGTDRAHLLLTPSGADNATGLTYSVAYDTTPGNFIDAYLSTCNYGDSDINDGNTHFNLLVIDAQ
jgi:hypothetical protein